MSQKVDLSFWYLPGSLYACSLGQENSVQHTREGLINQKITALRGHGELYYNSHSSFSPPLIVEPVMWEEVVMLLLFFTLIPTGEQRGFPS